MKGIKAIFILFVSIMTASTAAAENAPASPPTYPNARVFGFVHFWSKLDNVNGKLRNLNMNVARARLGALGEIRKGVAFTILTEGGELANSYITGSRALNLVDCHATIKFHPLLSLRLGQDFYRFTYEGDLILPKLPFIFRAPAIDAVWLTMGRNGLYAYDFGAWIFNNPQDSKLPLRPSYQISLTNGTGLNKSDDNEQKDLTARIVVEPLSELDLPVVKSLRVGGSFFMGYSKTMIDTAAKRYANLRDMIWAAEIVLPTKYGRIMAEGVSAYFRGEGEVARRWQWGGYAALGITPIKNLELLGRYELYDQAQGPHDAALRSPTLLKSATLGLTYTIAKLTDVKLNYLVREYGSGYQTPANAVRGDLVIAQLQFMW